MNCFEYLNSELNKIKDLQTERSFYPILKEFLKKFAEEYLKNKREINVISEASSKVHETKIGFPDLTVQVKHYDFKTVGWVEVKLPKDSLNDPKFNEQFHRYTDSLENVLITNLREWSLYQWDEKGKPKKVDEVLFDATEFSIESKSLTRLLDQFFEGKVLEIKTPKQLALSLARKTRLLSKQVEESLEEAMKNEDNENNLIKLKSAFSNTLIKDIEPHQFANMAAETIAYSFFLAALEHQKRGNQDRLTLTTAIDYLPDSVPVLRDLYDLIGKSAKNDETIKLSVESLIEQFQKADMEKIYNALSKHQIGQDPVIHFYEPFLAEYDPKEREARGVYYTPKPVVDYIVKSVDWILREKFGKVAGIEDREVFLLDPATGTGTFLMSAIEMIAENKKRQFGALGEEMVRKEFIRVTQNHILKHFFGFELMIAPYAMAHLKLTMLLEEFGFDFSMTENNDDKDDDRLKIYLANTLDEPHNYTGGNQVQMNMDELTFYQNVSKESREASKVKSEAKVMAIIGNPPYSGISSNKNKWIDDLLKIGYKRKDGSIDKGYYQVDGKPLGEKKLWLQDDYVKFIRFAQWKIDQMDEGVIGFVTNHGFIDNSTFRGMRQNLMNSFTDIYILNLHGSSKKNEISKGIEKDENVFKIQTGVCILFLVKDKNTLNKVYYSELWGCKNSKLEKLSGSDISSTEWEEIIPKAPYYFFTNKCTTHDDEYGQFSRINEMFNVSTTGVLSAMDQVSIGFNNTDLIEKMNLILDVGCSNELLEEKFNITNKNRWKIQQAREKHNTNDLTKLFVEILYRPFDNRVIVYDDSFVWRTRKKVMVNMEKNNLGIVTCRQTANSDWNHAIISKTIIDDSFISNRTKERSYIFPLYVYENDSRFSNFKNEILKNYKQFVDSDRDIESTEDILNYLYGILFLPTYRNKYFEQLAVDFPRIPLPYQVVESKLIDENIKDPKEAFEKISNFGNKLKNLHLLTDPIFGDPSKWGVKPGGAKPENLDDWKVTKVEYKQSEKRVYVNDGQYFEGIEPEVWRYYIGGYQVLDKWLKDRKKAEKCLSLDDLMHYMKIVVSLRETITVTKKV